MGSAGAAAVATVVCWADDRFVGQLRHLLDKIIPSLTLFSETPKFQERTKYNIVRVVKIDP